MNMDELLHAWKRAVLPEYVLLGLLVGALCHSLANGIVVDDAFNSYRYAEIFAEGHGLVFNEGERFHAPHFRRGGHVRGTIVEHWTVMTCGVVLSMDCHDLKLPREQVIPLKDVPSAAPDAGWRDKGALLDRASDFPAMKTAISTHTSMR